MIQELLSHGRENAISTSILCALTGLSERRLRGKIMEERKRGAIILYAPGGHGGYFLPSTDQEQAKREMLSFFNVQRARCFTSFAALRPVARELGVPAGQLEFDGVENLGK